MGKIGDATGYPALRVTTGSASEVAEWADKDLLVLGNPGNQPLFTQWAAHIVWLQWNLSRNPFLLGRAGGSGRHAGCFSGFRQSSNASPQALEMNLCLEIRT